MVTAPMPAAVATAEMAETVETSPAASPAAAVAVAVAHPVAVVVAPVVAPVVHRSWCITTASVR